MNPEELAALCAAAMPEEQLTAAELAHVCYGAPSDEVLGDERGAVALAYNDTAAWIRLVVVRPDLQGRGHGRRLLDLALDRARERGATTVHLASSIPRYLWPGVDLTNTAANALVESAGFRRHLVGINMAIPTSFRREPPASVTIEREEGRGAVEFAAREYPHWIPELQVAIEKGTAFAARDADGATIGFGCHSCNRTAWIGPMATQPGRKHGGVGSAVLAAVCEDLERRGHASGEIAWVSNVRFYGKCGATISRVFQSGSLEL